MDRNQHGIGMVEVMTAMAIGSVLLLGSLTVFSKTNVTARNQSSVATLNDNGRFAVEVLRRNLLMAGFRNEAWQTDPIDDALVVVDGATDQLTVRFQAPRDCVRNSTAATAGIAVNVFDVNDGALRCNGQEIIAGVENFQVLFGEDTDGDGVANRVVTGSTAGLQIDRVVFVQLGLLLATDRDDVLDTNQQMRVYSAADGAGTDQTYSDGRLHREFTSVVALRNPT